MSLTVDMQNATNLPTPSQQHFESWVSAALSTANTEDKSTELSIRIVEPKESAELNLRYRNKDNATNVLSFPTEFAPGFDLPQLGDLIICADLVNQEALQQNKTSTAHWAHLTVHGVLHLLGYDHIEDIEAEQMEAIEIEILEKIKENGSFSR